METWLGRESAKFALAPSQLALDPADEIQLSAGGRSWRLRLTQIDDAGARSMAAVLTDPSLYEPVSGPARNAAVSGQLMQSGRPVLTFLDLPPLSSMLRDDAPYAAAFAVPWPGGVQIWRSPGDDGFVLDTTLTRAACIGETASVLYPGPPGRFDLASTLDIELYGGTLASVSQSALFGGANLLAIQNPEGAWELIQFAQASLTAPNCWTLSMLLRGQAGTEGAMGSPVPAGARAVLIDAAVAQLSLDASQYLLPLNWSYGPAGKPLSDPSFQAAAPLFTGAGLRPFSPAALGARFDASGNLVLSWIRRDRAPSADAWEQSEIALSEASELYDVEILNGAGAVTRTVSAAGAPPLLYSAAQIAADFPAGLPQPFVFRVYQLSASLGRGTGRSVSLMFA